MSNDLLTRSFRSRLNSLPLDLRCQIGEIPLQKGILAVNRKKMCIECLNDFHIPFLEAGTGTNRFIIKYDGYAIKIALDREGIADNKQEWAISGELAPDVAETYEVSSGGHLLSAAYVPAFTSASEMYAHSQSIQKILKGWSDRGYLLGDVGLTKINYANWGCSRQGRPVCIDYAYIFPIGMDIAQCLCGCDHLVFADSTYTSYKCPACGHIYQDRDLRDRISTEERMRLFRNISGVKMKNTTEEHAIDPKYIKHEHKPSDPDPLEATAMALSMHFGSVENYRP